MFDFKYLSIFISLILAFHARAELDSQREASYQKIHKRYSKSFTSPEENQTESSEGGGFETSFNRLINRARINSDAIVEEKLFFAFAQRGDGTGDNLYSSNAFYLNPSELLSLGVRFEDSEILFNRFTDKRTFGPGDYVIVRSSVFSTSRESFRTSLSRFERERKLTNGITYTVLG